MKKVFKIFVFLFMAASSVLFWTACSKDNMAQPSENEPTQQMVSSNMTQNTVLKDQPIGLPPPPPGFRIRVRSISSQCTGKSINSRTLVVLETVPPYTSYSPTGCYRFWYRRVGTTTWQYVSICNQPQNLFNLNLAIGQYELIVGPGDVTNPISVLCSIAQPFTVRDCRIIEEEF